MSDHNGTRDRALTDGGAELPSTALCNPSSPQCCEPAEPSHKGTSRSRPGKPQEEGLQSLAFQTLPDASSGEVIGLLDYLNARGGRENVFQIASEIGCAVQTVINAVKAAELLNFVSTPGPLVVLESEGRRFLRSSAPERAALWRKRLLRQRCFREVHDALRMRPNRRIDREVVLETLKRCAPRSSGEKSFRAFVDWGRRGELFAYAEHTRLFSV